MIYFKKGRLTEELIGLNPKEPAFRTGYGFFETIAWNGNKICHLDLHLARPERVWLSSISLKQPLIIERQFLMLLKRTNLRMNLPVLIFFFLLSEEELFQLFLQFLLNMFLIEFGD